MKNKIETEKKGLDSRKKSVSMKTGAKHMPMGKGTGADKKPETRTSSHFGKNVHQAKAGAPINPTKAKLAFNNRGGKKALRYKPGKSANR